MPRLIVTVRPHPAIKLRPTAPNAERRHQHADR
jgi:hypothetical protein